VEVLVAVAIIVFIGAVLLKIVSNNTFFISSLLQKKSSNSFISILPKINKDEKKRKFIMQSVVAAKFPTINDELKHFLKDKKVYYTDQLISVKSILDTNDSGDADEYDTDYDEQSNKDQQIDFKIQIRKKIITSIDEKTKKKNLEYIYYIGQYQP